MNKSFQKTLLKDWGGGGAVYTFKFEGVCKNFKVIKILADISVKKNAISILKIHSKLNF